MCARAHMVHASHVRVHSHTVHVSHVCMCMHMAHFSHIRGKCTHMVSWRDKSHARGTGAYTVRISYMCVQVHIHVSSIGNTCMCTVPFSHTHLHMHADGPLLTLTCASTHRGHISHTCACTHLVYNSDGSACAHIHSPFFMVEERI